jgi:hypothetical protein
MILMQHARGCVDFGELNTLRARQLLKPGYHRT